MNNPPTPPEMECLGFKLSNADIKFKKGYLEMSCGYKLIDEPSDPDICEKFIRSLREGPKEALEQGAGLFDGSVDPASFWEDKKKEMEERLTGTKNVGDEEFEQEEVVDLDEEPKVVQEEL